MEGLDEMIAALRRIAMKELAKAPPGPLATNELGDAWCSECGERPPAAWRGQVVRVCGLLCLPIRLTDYESEFSFWALIKATEGEKR